MTDASYPTGLALTRFAKSARAKPREASLPLPAPQPFSAPVLIGDCATPLAGETLLSLLWRRLERGAEGEDPSDRL